MSATCSPDLDTDGSGTVCFGAEGGRVRPGADSESPRLSSRHRGPRPFRVSPDGVRPAQLRPPRSPAGSLVRTPLTGSAPGRGEDGHRTGPVSSRPSVPLPARRGMATGVATFDPMNGSGREVAAPGARPASMQDLSPDGSRRCRGWRGRVRPALRLSTGAAARDRCDVSVRSCVDTIGCPSYPVVRTIECS
jgi:hypothetical protein